MTLKMMMFMLAITFAFVGAPVLAAPIHFGSHHVMFPQTGAMLPLAASTTNRRYSHNIGSDTSVTTKQEKDLIHKYFVGPDESVEIQLIEEAGADPSVPITDNVKGTVEKVIDPDTKQS